MNNFETKYRDILKNILGSNVIRNDRTGVGCKSLFNQSLSWKLKDGFPMITGRYISKKIFETEFKWFINGETNIRRFQDNNIKIWDAWANSNGDLGPVYGHQMLSYNSENKNQLESIISSLINNPDSRRHIINLWNPLQLDEMALPPCYLYFQFFVDNDKLNMFVLQRSGDMFLGVPYDICLFSRFLLYVAKRAGLNANQIDVQIIDAHIYNNQTEAVLEYLDTKIYPFPDFKFNNNKLNIINYIYDKKITAPVAV